MPASTKYPRAIVLFERVELDLAEPGGAASSPFARDDTSETARDIINRCRATGFAGCALSMGVRTAKRRL